LSKFGVEKLADLSNWHSSFSEEHFKEEEIFFEELFFPFFFGLWAKTNQFVSKNFPAGLSKPAFCMSTRTFEDKYFEKKTSFNKCSSCETKSFAL